MKNILFLLFICCVRTGYPQSIPSQETQIKNAVLAAPEDKRAGAMVYGYNEKYEMIVLRKGTNEMVCLADDPNEKGLNVSCYHKDLDPFMARGRELKKQGKGFQEIFDLREKEVKSGKLAMPKHPSTLFVFTADEKNYNAESGEVKKGYLRSVIYISYATSESSGLPTAPASVGLPWIMFPGTHAAHIMINPAKKED